MKYLKQHGEIIIYLLLMAIAAGLRFYELDLRAIHHDESLHAYYSWKLYMGNGYQHDPMMHGPFQFILNAFIFLLFKASDYTLRILPAFFGTILVGLPYLFRKQAGRYGAIIMAIFFTVSPSFLFFSRFARNDIYIAVWSLVLIICMWRYFEEGKSLYLYISAAVLALSFATKEVTFFYVGILCSFLFFVCLREAKSIIKNKFDFSRLSRPASFFLLIFTLSLPQLSASVSLFQKNLGVILANGNETAGPVGIPFGGGFLKDFLLKVVHRSDATPVINAPGSGIPVALLIIAIFIIISVVIGIRWNPKKWLICAAIFYGIYILLYTTFFTNPLGFGSGIWQSLGYWIVQQGVKRGSQPWYYYFYITPIYEFLPLILSTIGGIYYLIKGKLFECFLVYWAVLAFVLFTYSGEKMPWLIIHITLPLIVLSSKWLGEYITSRGWRTEKLLVLLLIVALFSYSVRISLQASYRHSDNPVEMFDYAQGSADLTRVMAEVEKEAEKSGQGKEIKILVDTSGGLSWPAAWYFRDYKNAGYPDLTSISAEPDASVVLLSAANELRASPFLKKYGEGEKFSNLIWFPEDYKKLKLKDIFNKTTWKDWWEYFINRRVQNPYIHTEGIVYFRK